MARPHIEPYVDTIVPFKSMTLAGFAKGFGYKMLSLDTDSGACTMSVQLAPDTVQKPSVSESDIELYVCSGELSLGDKPRRRGHYLFVPAGVAMPEIRTSKGAHILLMFNTSFPTLRESDRDMDGADRNGLISINSLDDLSWQQNQLVPSTAPGCLVKLLKFDPVSRAMTFLYFMGAGYNQDNIAYHDCVEEGYHVFGTSWMMQFGELPRGGYFYRPPYINHGPFGCEIATLGFGRTDAELYNHYHADPFTDPQENHSNAVAKMMAARPTMFTWMRQDDHNHPVMSIAAE